MRICFVPAPTFPRLASESVIQMFFTMIRNWLKMREDLWFYMVVPRDAFLQGLKVPPKTTIVPLEDTAPVYYDKHCDVPVGFYQKFGMRTGEFPIDAVITTRTNAAVIMQRQLWDYRLKGVIPVIIDEDMAVNPGAMPAPMPTTDVDMLNRSMAYAAAWPVFDTDLEMANALTTARKYLSGTMMKRMEGRCKVIPPGVDTSWIEENIPYGMPKNGKFTLFFGGRLNAAKRAEKMVEIYDKMYAAGHDVRVVLCTPKSDDKFKENYVMKYGRTEVEINSFKPPDEFYPMAASSHVYLASSRMEGFSIGFLEQVYLAKYGLVPILPNLPWCRTLLPIDDYRLVYKDFAEAAGMIRWVKDNYELAVKEAQWLSDYVKETYDAKKMCRLYLDYVEERVEEFTAYRRLFSKGGTDLMKMCADRLKPPLSVDDLYAAMNKYAEVGKYDATRGKASKYVAYKWLIEEGGYEDLHDGPVPRLKLINGRKPMSVHEP